MEDNDVLATCKTVVKNRDISACCQNPHELLQKLDTLVFEMASPFITKTRHCVLFDRSDDPFIELIGFERDFKVLQFLQRDLNINNNSNYDTPVDNLSPEVKSQFFKVLEEGIDLCNKCEELKSKYDSTRVWKKFKHFFKNTFIDDSRDSWYTKYVYAMHEFVLHRYKFEIEAYRFIWLSTFDNLIVIRIENDKDTYTLDWKLCNGEGGDLPGEWTRDGHREINKEVWDKFQDLLNEIQFWKMNTISNERINYDGARLILEGKAKSHYHVVDRWAPKQDDSFYKCYDFLIGLTDLNIEEE